jgi:hypothetical protein
VVVSQWEAPALQYISLGETYGYFAYVYGSQSTYAYYDWLYSHYAAVYAQWATQTHDPTLWAYAYWYAYNAAIYGYYDYITTGDIYGYYSSVYDYYGWADAYWAYTDEIHNG